MRDIKLRYFAPTALAALLLAGGLATIYESDAQKIVCWKDKTGKTVGCGDKVPPEYQDSATRELDKRGVTRNVTESAEDKAKRMAKEKEVEKEKAELAKKQAEQKRLDSALLNTYSNEKEIDLQRDRDLATIDGRIAQLQVMLKNAKANEASVKGRVDTVAKSGKAPPDGLKDELARAEADVRRHENGIADKEKEKDDVRKRYAAMRARYVELRGGGGSAPAPAPAPSAKK